MIEVRDGSIFAGMKMIRLHNFMRFVIIPIVKQQNVDIKVENNLFIYIFCCKQADDE